MPWSRNIQSLLTQSGYYDEWRNVDRKTCADGFIDWFNNELKYLHYCASLSAPNIFPKHSVWNWEFNEEFDRYFPTYMEMLHEVDTMNDCLERKLLNGNALLERLNPEFKAKYAINSLQHPHLRIMSRMLRRKVRDVRYRRRTDEIDKCLLQLINLKPYIKIFGLVLAPFVPKYLSF